MLTTSVKRKGAFTPIPRYVKKQVARSSCAICYQPYGRVYSLTNGIVRHPRQVFHHLLARRWLAEHGIYEHHPSNLISICQFCHGTLKIAEDRLYQGDLLTFLQINKRVGIDPNRIRRFALSVGIKEFTGVTV